MSHQAYELSTVHEGKRFSFTEPEADWGHCAVCGNEVLVAAPEVLILVGPE